MVFKRVAMTLLLMPSAANKMIRDRMASAWPVFARLVQATS